MRPAPFQTGVEFVLVETNGTRLFVQQDSEAGDPVLLLHFGMSHLGVWDLVVPYLTDRYRVVRVDLRGHGRSDRLADGYTLEKMGRDILGVMDHLGIERAHLVGSSMGAEVAASMAAQAQNRVISLALEGAFQNCFGRDSIYGEPSEAKKAELRAARAARPPLVGDTPEEAVAQWLRRWGRPDDERMARALRGAIGPLPDGRYAPLGAYAQNAYMESFWEARFDRFYEAINRPVLFLPDAASAADPTAQASIAWFRSILRHSAVVNIPGAQHAAVLVDQPERFARAVMQFHRHLSLLT